jgi:hypothetical protein
MKRFRKEDFPVSEIRRFLEPGPIVLVSSAWQGKTNIMTMGWHMVLGFSPSLIGCYLWDENHSFEMIRRSSVPGVRPHARAHRESRSSPDQGMLRELRMQAGGKQPDLEMGPVHLGGGQSPCGDLAQVS